CRPIWIRCNHCMRSIATNTLWVCGSCHAPNRDTLSHPFVAECQACQTEPKAYKCHHCQNLIFLSADEDPSNCACRLNSSVRDKHAQDVENSETPFTGTGL